MSEVARRSQGVLVNVAGLLYGWMGFSLSVLAAIIHLFYSPKLHDASAVPTYRRVAPRSAGRRKIIRSESDKVQMSPGRVGSEPKLIPLPPKRSDERERKASFSKKEIAPSRHFHRRSKSMANIPIITIDYFGSTDILNSRRSAEFPKLEPRIPQTVTKPSNPPSLPIFSSMPASSISHSNTVIGDDDRPVNGFRLFGLKPWNKERPRGLERRQSSPQLCRSGTLPQPSCRKQSGSEGVPTSPANYTKKPLERSCRVPSVPVEGKEKIGIKIEVSVRQTGKKRSQTLRTDPYDAPYFAIPPVPPLPQAYKRSPVQTLISPNISERRI